MNWGTMSRDERDAAYNNTEAVKNRRELNVVQYPDRRPVEVASKP